MNKQNGSKRTRCREKNLAIRDGLLVYPLESTKSDVQALKSTEYGQSVGLGVSSLGKEKLD